MEKKRQYGGNKIEKSREMVYWAVNHEDVQEWYSRCGDCASVKSQNLQKSCDMYFRFTDFPVLGFVDILRIQDMTW